MLCPNRLGDTIPAPRTIEQALDDLIERLDALPPSHPDVPAIKRQIEGLELHLMGR